ncbi:3094_t:CDS:2 [Entrophospora sp. SA101]|nr:3094_t:CDS:2 [Entrophospora sp. SA101]CAJ0836908.1 6420_t:CDS:2 [Entrophospora sp. SA101]
MRCEHGRPIMELRIPEQGFKGESSVAFDALIHSSRIFFKAKTDTRLKRDDEDDENDEDVDSKKDDEIGEEDLEFNSR